MSRMHIFFINKINKVIGAFLLVKWYSSVKRKIVQTTFSVILDRLKTEDVSLCVHGIKITNKTKLIRNIKFIQRPFLVILI